MTLGFTLVSHAFPPQRRGSALGIYFAVTGVAVASGPLVGGAVTEGIDWPWIFWLNVPLGLVLIPFVLARMEESRGPDVALDLPGLALATVGLLGIVWALVRANDAGWTSLEVVATMAGGLALLAAFVFWQLRAPRPMLPMRFFADRAFSAGNGAIFLAVGALFCGVFFMAQFLQTALGYGPLDAGLRLLPWTATLFFVAPVAGKAVDRIGERPFLVAGPLLQAIGLGWIALIADAGMSYAELIPPLMVAGVGISMSFPAAQNSVISAVAPDRDRQGLRRQQHDARTRRRLRHRRQRDRLRRAWRLRLPAVLRRRVRRGDDRRDDPLRARRGRRRTAAAARRRPRGAGAGRRCRRCVTVTSAKTTRQRSPLGLIGAGPG